MRVSPPTLGQKLKEVASAQILLTEAAYLPGQNLPWHEHERATFCIVLDGSLTEELGADRHVLRRFDVTFKPEGTAHRDTYGASGARCLIVELATGWLSQLRSGTDLIDRPIQLCGTRLLDFGIRLERELEFVDPLSSLSAEALALEMLVYTSRSNTVREHAHIPAWLRRVREALREEFVDRPSLTDLAAGAGVHPVHLVQTFKKAFGMSIGHYVRELRITRAAHDLATTDRSITEVALASGFYDQSHFHRTFREHLGVTPGQYRAQHRPN